MNFFQKKNSQTAKLVCLVVNGKMSLPTKELIFVSVMYVSSVFNTNTDIKRYVNIKNINSFVIWRKCLIYNHVSIIIIPLNYSLRTIFISYAKTSKKKYLIIYCLR